MDEWVNMKCWQMIEKSNKFLNVIHFRWPCKAVTTFLFLLLLIFDCSEIYWQDLTVSILISVRVWERSCKYFLHLLTPSNVTYGTRLLMYICVKPPIWNTVWRVQVLEIFVWSYSIFTDIRALKVMNILLN